MQELWICSSQRDHCLSCKQSLSFYYKHLGFTSNYVQVYLSASECQPIVQQMHVCEVLKQNPNNTDNKIMRINQVCNRFVNYVSYHPKNVESILYSGNDEDECSQWSDLSLSQALFNTYSNEIKQMIHD